MPSSYTSSATKPVYFGVRIIWYILGLVEFLLAIRFLLKMMGANASAGFTAFIYMLSQPLAAPFLTVFPNAALQGLRFEWTTLLAMLAYWFLAWALSRLFMISRPVSTPEAATVLKKKDEETL